MDGFVWDSRRMSSTNAVALPLIYKAHSSGTVWPRMSAEDTDETWNIVMGDFFWKTLSEKVLRDGKHEEFLLLPYSHSVSASSQLTGYFFRGKGICKSTCIYMRSIHHLYFCAIYCHMGDANRERFHQEFIKRFTLTNTLLLWRFCTVHNVLFTAYSVIPLVSVPNVASDWTLSEMWCVYGQNTREKVSFSFNNCYRSLIFSMYVCL